MAVSSGARIATNINALNSYNALNSISKKTGTVALRLATGVRLNSAGDDPATFTIARKMQARSRAIAQSINNVGDAKSVLAIAEGGLLNISELMLTIKEKVSQATNGVFGPDEMNAIATQIQDYMNEIEDIVAQTKFSSQTLLYNGVTGGSATGPFNKPFQVGPDSDNLVTVAIMTTIDAGAMLGTAAASVTSGLLGSSTLLGNLASAVDAGINKISGQIQYIGSLSNRLDFKEDMLSVSKTNIDASISRMYDADLAKEQMEMVKLQILQNTATAQLAQANAAPQLYLQLFQ
jgi:flagellin